ncbi:MAG: N-acetylmuramic acid 6-phosphate etherase [Bryobacterales bacterium]|nr:N-acetylmuramic acid 6-phosphate etherase [Bryobacterales bacterium]MBV9396431.1 N-acetylmuramic acid 6-phosphate etherase [Bryobacterales bacterium]
MLEKLLTEQVYAPSRELHSSPTIEILQIMNQADAEIAAAVAREIPAIARAVEAIASALQKGGRLFYYGAGTSGRLGVLDAAECPPTFHTSPDLVQAIIAGGDTALRRSVEKAEDDPSAGASDLRRAGFNAQDVAAGISASGRTPYVLGAMAEARRVGAVTCGISCSQDSELSRAVDYPIQPQPGPEVIAGSTRLRAGTATKLVLNMISTAVMVKLGHVYGNLMVNVQPSNSKLQDRARRIVQKITGVDFQRAAELLDQGGRSVRTAIVMEKMHLPRKEAEELLARADGKLAEVLR